MADVTPYQVGSSINYDRLVDQFGTERISQELLARLQALTELPLHPWLTRGLFYSHRSLEQVCLALEKKEKVYLYTGRGASSGSLHLGHLIPFMLTQWFQQAFDLPVVIQLTDDEKFFHKDLTLQQCSQMALDNIRDIISVGFRPEQTFIFRDTDYLGAMYPNVCQIQKAMNVNQVQKAFGFTLDDNVGKYAYVAIQAVPSFSSSFPQLFGEKSSHQCLIPCAIDQDPFFRMTRDIAPRLKYRKPAVIHSKFFPALQGTTGKMSSSEPQSAIFLDDTATLISEKIKKHAFSGGRTTWAEQQIIGADLTVDVSYQYLEIFLWDDRRLTEIRAAYGGGTMKTSELKQILIDLLIELTRGLQEKRQAITPELLAAFMTPKPM